MKYSEFKTWLLSTKNSLFSLFWFWLWASLAVWFFLTVIEALYPFYDYKQESTYWKIARYLPVENSDKITAINPVLCHLFEREPEFYMRIQDSNDNFVDLLRLDRDHWVYDEEHNRYLFKENSNYGVKVESSNGELEIRLRYLNS